MVSLFRSRWVQVGTGTTLGAALAVALTLVVILNGSPDPFTGDHVSLTSGGALRAQTEEPGAVSIPITITSDELPLTAAEAIAAGWMDPFLCDPGRGRFFRKGPESDALPYFLMFNSDDQLIGVYLFVVSEREMPPPWAMWDELKAAGIAIIDYEHWNLLVYFRDSTRACTPRP